MSSIDGLIINLDFISADEEAALIEKMPKTKTQAGKHRNSVQRYGSMLPYTAYWTSKVIPDHLEILCQKLEIKGVFATKPDSVSINEYHKGQSIAYHTDSPQSGEIIAILSLLNEAILNFKKGVERYQILLPRRSLLVMQGEARWRWEHGIERVNDLRYSIVFRDSEAIN